MGTVKLKDFRSAVLASQTEALAKLRDISQGKLHENYWHAYEQQLREAGRLLQAIDANPDAAIAALSAPQPPAEAQPCGCGEATCVVPWEPGCGLGKSEQHAEAQAQGGGEEGFKAWVVEQMPAGTVIDNPALWADRLARAYEFNVPAPVAPVGVDTIRDGRAIVDEFLQCASIGRPHGKLIAQAKDWLADVEAALTKQPVPVAPVGVEGLVVKWKKESESLDIHPAGLAARRVCAIELEHALAQHPAAVDDVISAARAVAKEYDGPLEAIIYDSDDDEVGDRVCCRVRSYEPHAEGCPLIRLRAALAAQQGGGSDE